MDAVATVESEVRELIRRSGLDPARDARELDRLVREAVCDYDERSLHGGLPALANVEDAVKSVKDAVAGFGPLQPYFDDPEIEEIWINEPTKVFVARGGVAELTTTMLTPDRVQDLDSWGLDTVRHQLNTVPDAVPFSDLPDDYQE